MTGPGFRVGDLVSFNTALFHYHNSTGLIVGIERNNPMAMEEYYYTVLVTHPFYETPRLEYFSTTYLILIPT